MDKKGACERERPGIQSVEIGSRILVAMAEAGGSRCSRRTLRADATCQPRRCIATCRASTRTNLVAQEGDGRYSIGPAGPITLGLAGLYSLDVVRIASDS